MAIGGFVGAALFVAQARTNPLPRQFRWLFYLAIKMAMWSVLLLVALIFSAPGKDFSNSVSDGLFGMLLISCLASIGGVFLAMMAYKERTMEWIYRMEMFSAIYSIWVLALFAFTIVAHALISLLGSNVFLIAYLFIILLIAFFIQIANVYICRVIMERMMDGEEPRVAPPPVTADVEVNPVRTDRADTIPEKNKA